MNMAEQVATEIQPCYEVAWGKLKEKQEKRKISVIQRWALPPLPHPKTRLSRWCPSPLQRPPRKQLWQVDHKKAAILPRNSCAPSSIPPNFMGDLFSFGLAGSICQPFVRSLHSPRGGSGLCQVKPRCIRKLLWRFCTSGANSRPVVCCGAWAASPERQGQEKRQMKGISHHTGNNGRAWDQAFCRCLVAHSQLGFIPAPGLCPYSRYASYCTLPLYMWKSKVGWPAAISFLLIDNHQYGHFPNI